MERKRFVNYYFLYSYRRKKILVSLNLYINENYYKDIITSITFDWKILNQIEF